MKIELSFSLHKNAQILGFVLIVKNKPADG